MHRMSVTTKRLHGIFLKIIQPCETFHTKHKIKSIQLYDLNIWEMVKLEFYHDTAAFIHFIMYSDTGISQLFCT